MSRIAVIGCGVIGLPTALAIQNQLKSRVKVTIFADKFSPNTTGDVAAGLWTPYLLQNNPPEKIFQWAKVTQDYILKLWKEGKAEEAGISLQLVVTLSDSKEFSVPVWVSGTLGHSVLSEDSLNYYKNVHKENFTGGFTYVTFIWEATKFLPYLQNQFILNGGEMIEKQVKNFEELSDFDVIVNSTGLNARLLTEDNVIRPIRGQIIRVEAPWQFNTIMFDTQRGNYIIPNQTCVILGGTRQMGDFNTEVNANDKSNILSGCISYVPSLNSANIIRDYVGLRPGRPEIRLEVENKKIGDKILTIVHDYGHGGSGITLSMGCAETAAGLVQDALGMSWRSKL